MQKRVIVIGGGLAGLSAADTLVDRGYEIIILERAPMAGGCTSSHVDHRDPLKRMSRKATMQMNFPFYCNLNWKTRKMLDGLGDLAGVDPRGIDWWELGNAAYSDKLDGFYFLDQHGHRSHLSSTPKSLLGRFFQKLPAPFSSLQTLWDFDGMPRFRDKLSSVPFFTEALLFGRMNPPPVNDDENFYGYLRRKGMTHVAIEAMRRITYSITNLADADQVGPKFGRLFFEAMFSKKGGFGCRMMNDDCNPALIDPMVKSLMDRGVKFMLNHKIKNFIVRDGRCRSVVVEDSSGGEAVICPNCGLLFPNAHVEAFCASCGHRFYAGFSLKPPLCKPTTIEADYFISAMQPHQLAKLYRDRDDHPLRQYPEFRALAQPKGAVLTVSRVFMDRKVTEGYNLTGLDRDFYSFNGAMDISHIMPKYKDASVFDTLSDDGEVLACYPEAELKTRLRADLAKLFPDMAGAKVEGHLMTHYGPDVLYHRPVPRLTSRFLPDNPVTSVHGLYLAGDWMDPDFRIGKEAAVKSGIRAANAIMEADDRSDFERILEPVVAPITRWMQTNWISRFILSRYEKRYRAELPPRRG